MTAQSLLEQLRFRISTAPLYGKRWSKVALVSLAVSMVWLMFPMLRLKAPAIGWLAWSFMCLGWGAWAIGLGVLLSLGPLPLIRRSDGRIVARMPRWRRAVIPVTTAIPMVAIATWLSWGIPGVVGIVAYLLQGFVRTGGYWVVDEDGVTQVRVLLASRRLEWKAIAGIDYIPEGIRIRSRAGQSMPIWGVALDGYPGVVAAILSFVPNVDVQPAEGRTALEDIASLAITRGRGSD